jgi:hypothetical protein
MMLNDSRHGPRAADQPRVVQLQVSRYTRALPRGRDPLQFLVGLHVEGTPVAWQRNATLTRDDEHRLLEGIDGLRRWSGGVGLTPRTARAAVDDIGSTLRDVFLGAEGRELLRDLDRTALLLVIDETILHLPWEMMRDDADGLLVSEPFGRIITTRLLTPSGRDLADEDPAVRILAVENPTEDLASSENVLEMIHRVREFVPDIDLEVTTLARRDATRAGLAAAVDGRDFDIIHFAGHGTFDTSRPADSAVVLSDGPFTDEQVADLRWSRPPFVVFNGSCESARAAGGVRIVSNRRRSNGLAAAFLSRGVEAYLGNYFLVDDASAAAFSLAFYTTMLRERNVGRAVQVARDDAIARYESHADLTGLGAVFFGDCGTAQRRDLATAA